MSLEKIEALEARIGKVIDLVRALKEDKARLEGEISRMQEELGSNRSLEEEAKGLRQEKEQVRDRLENILKGIEDLDL